MSRWVVKSGRYFGFRGWYAYRSGQFDVTAVGFFTHDAAFRFAEKQASYERSRRAPKCGRTREVGTDG